MGKIEAFEIERMLFGEAPPEFMIEVFLRGLVLYLFMLFIVRFLGKRMAGEITVAQMVIMITLGGTVTIAMQVPEGGTLVGIVALGIIFLLERLVSYLTVKNPRFEQFTQGKVEVLVKDGIIQNDKLDKLKLTHRQIFGALRNREVRHLGEVERMYLEADGSFSLFRLEDDVPAGLPVLPPQDHELLDEQELQEGLQSCGHCGHTSESRDNCSVCGQKKWTIAIR